MKKIKNNSLLVSFLILTVVLCSSITIVKAQNDKSINGEDHRSTVSTFVKSLQDAATIEQDGIGEEIKTVATEQEKSKDKVADAIDKINNRNNIKTFLIGTDYKNLGELRSETVKNENQIDQLKRLLDKTTNTETKTSLQAQIQTLEQEKIKIDNFIKTNENKFSLFGWFVKLFNK